MPSLLLRNSSKMPVKHTYEMEPFPLEQTDPKLAEYIRQIANREHPTVRGLYIGMSKLFIHFKSNDPNVNGKGPVKVIQLANRNDPCPCGSGRKFKKCCGK